MITNIIRYRTAIYYIISITRNRFRPYWVSSGGCKKQSIINMLKKDKFALGRKKRCTKVILFFSIKKWLVGDPFKPQPNLLQELNCRCLILVSGSDRPLLAAFIPQARSILVGPDISIFTTPATITKNC